MTEKATAAASNAPAKTDEEIWAELQASETNAPPADEPPVARTDEDDEDEPIAANAPDNAPADDGESSDDESSDDGDPWATAPEPLRKAYQDAQTQIERLRGTMSGRARADAERMRELEAELKRLRSSTPQSPPADKAAGDDEAIKRLEEEYPDIARPLIQKIAQQDQRLATLQRDTQAWQQAVQEREAAVYAANAAQVQQTHGDYVGLIRKHGVEFQAWADDQPKAIRDAIARNWDAARDPSELDTILTAFKEHIGVQSPDTPPATAGTSGTSLTDRRRQQAAAIASPRTSRQSPRTPSAKTPEEEWEDLRRKGL